MKKHLGSTPVDEGYAWVILIACFGIYLMLMGSVRCFGILYTEFLDYFDAGAGHTAWIGSVCMFLITVSGPFSNCLVSVYSIRKVALCGGLLASAGYLLSAFVPHMELMYLTIGIISGVGYGQLLTPATTIINFYFAKRRGLAVGLMSSGIGIGGFILPYLYRFIVDTYGIMGALIIISGILLHFCVFGALLREPVEQKHAEKFSRSPTDNKARLCSCFVGAKIPEIKCSLFKYLPFIIPILSMTINAVGYASYFTVLPSHTKSLGYSKQDVAMIFSIIGATEVFARPAFGWFVDLKIVKTKTILLISFIVPGICGLIIPQLPYLPTLGVYAGVIGIFPGLYVSLMPVIVLERVGLDLLSPAIGLAIFCFSFGLLISQPIAGWLEDMTGTWDNSFRFIGAAHLTAFTLLLLEPYILCCKSKENLLSVKSDTAGSPDEVLQAEGLEKDQENKYLTNEKDSEMVSMTLLDKR